MRLFFGLVLSYGANILVSSWDYAEGLVRIYNIHTCVQERNVICSTLLEGKFAALAFNFDWKLFTSPSKMAK